MNYPHRSHFQYDRTPSRRRVVVTGVGAVSAAGVGAVPLWDTLMAGRSCIGPISRVMAEGLPISVAAEVRDFEPTKHIEAWQRPKRMGRVTQFAVVAAREALANAGLTVADLKGRRVAVIIGSAVSTLEVVEDMTRRVDKGGARGVNAVAIAGSNLQAAPVAVAEMLQMDDANVLGFTNNCTSGVDAIGIATDMIRLGRYDLIVAGGAEAPLSPATTSVITASGICTTSTTPEAASRPFDREREGGVIGEGAGVVILEEYSAAMDRDAKPYLEILGTHTCPDLTRTLPSSGLEYTMKGALENACCEPRDIDFISAWGCGDPLLDRCENNAIKAVFGGDAYRVAVSSIKGAIGIPLAASGPLQLIATAFAHRYNVLPPSVNWKHQDIDCDLDYVGARMRRVRLRKSVINAHGLSGGNISIVVASV